jgi:hypothetical protein
VVAIPDVHVNKLPVILGTRKESKGCGSSTSELKRACKSVPNFKGIYFQDSSLPIVVVMLGI